METVNQQMNKMDKETLKKMREIQRTLQSIKDGTGGIFYNVNQYQRYGLIDINKKNVKDKGSGRIFQKADIKLTNKGNQMLNIVI